MTALRASLCLALFLAAFVSLFAVATRAPVPTTVAIAEVPR